MDNKGFQGEDQRVQREKLKKMFSWTEGLHSRPNTAMGRKRDVKSCPPTRARPKFLSWTHDNRDGGAGAADLANATTMQSNNADSNMDLVTSSNPVLSTPGLNNPTWNRQQAVSVRHAFKIYGSSKNPNHVIQNLSMTVAKGSIYGLLGASGCGKTTLLSCIVGRRRLNSGEIWVLGGKPGTKGSGVPGKRVGYMPQEIALYGEFTIRETMMYFGWIFGMCTAEIVERLRFLLQFLDLPSQNRLVKNLSGGQQRRVSFAVALMHDPELLILDEPTVGVDPLLRQSH